MDFLIDLLFACNDMLKKIFDVSIFPSNFFDETYDWGGGDHEEGRKDNTRYWF